MALFEAEVEEEERLANAKARVLKSLEAPEAPEAAAAWVRAAMTEVASGGTSAEGRETRSEESKGAAPAKRARGTHTHTDARAAAALEQQQMQQFVAEVAAMEAAPKKRKSGRTARTGVQSRMPGRQREGAGASAQGAAACVRTHASDSNAGRAHGGRWR
jgi:hypothetical protein